MKKIININMDENHFLVSSDEILITKISKTSLSINGKDIFDKLIKTMDRTTKFEFEVNFGSEISNTNDLRICNDIQRIFENIANEINIKLKLQTEDIDNLLDEISEDLPF